MSTNTNENADKGLSKILTPNDPMRKWDGFESDLTMEFDPTSMFNGQAVSNLGIDDYSNSTSNWYFDKIFENPYISSTLYFYQSDFNKNATMGIVKYKEEQNSETSETTASGDFFQRIGTCIVRQPSFFVDNKFDQTGSNPFSSINTKIFRSLKQIASYDKYGFGWGIGANANSISNVLELLKQDQEEGSFWNTITQNALNIITSIKNNLNYLNTVQFESDAGLSRAFMANSISSPLHATFFFLQKTAKVDAENQTNRERAAKLLKYFLPHQKLYTSWIDGDSGVLTDLNPEFKTIVEDVRKSINNTAAQIGVSTATDTVSNITSNFFNGGVITTMSPGGFMTSNHNAIERARNGMPDKRTFILITPWGMRMNLLPSNIQITESQSKVIVNGNKILPMFIQIDVDFIPSRKLLTQDVMSQILNKYNSNTFISEEDYIKKQKESNKKT